MARNEEKQLARLNRFYLEKQKQDELKKRPPRPRLDTLNTPRELRKWLPTITRDIEFYVKQMEVPCYTDSKIEEISEQVQRLKQEYRAYLHKLRILEPDVSASSWANRPYTNRKRPAERDGGESRKESEDTIPHTTSSLPAFTPIPTPILQHLSSIPRHYGPEKAPPVIWNANPDTEDKPLEFAPPVPAITCSKEGAKKDQHTGHSQTKGHISHSQAERNVIHSQAERDISHSQAERNISHSQAERGVRHSQAEGESGTKADAASQSVTGGDHDTQHDNNVCERLASKRQRVGTASARDTEIQFAATAEKFLDCRANLSGSAQSVSNHLTAEGNETVEISRSGLPAPVKLPSSITNQCGAGKLPNVLSNMNKDHTLSNPLHLDYSDSSDEDV